ncbi:MAG TPA: SGNH/GDSL hydrolase family protein [Methylomirabilota bacterium]|nr:SGNH/GDSL hydrolase family protein [Methylomirabilota bacterium]
MATSGGKSSATLMLLVLLGGGLGFALAEVGIRLVAPQPTGPTMFAYDPILGSVPTPDQTAVRTFPGGYAYRYTNDAMGLRTVVRRIQARADFVVLLLGDSFTYGVGVDDDQTFASVLQANLDGAGLRVRVVNAGNPGKGTDYAVRFLEVYGRVFRPDLTVLGFFANDFSDNLTGDYYELISNGPLRLRDLSSSFYARKDYLRKSAIYNWIMSRSHAGNLVRLWVVGSMLPDLYRGGGSANNHIGRGVNPSYATPESVRVTEILVKELARLVAEAGGNLVSMYIPSSTEVETFRLSRIPSPDESAFMQIANRLGVPLFSLTQILADQPQVISMLYYREGHWTPLSHAIAASSLAGPVRSALGAR